jgi:PAS domain S-box-containing protein
MSSERMPRKALAAAGLAISLLLVELLADGTTIGSASLTDFIGTWSYHLLMGAAVVIVVARVVLIRDHRVAWSLIALGLVAWNAGDIFYYAVLAGDPSPPFPSPGDGLYLFLYVGFLGGLRTMGGGVRSAGPVSLALVVCVLGMASIWSWLVFGGVLETAVGGTAAVATTAAYPLLDLFLLASALIAVAARGWRLDRSFALLILGFGLMALADLIYAEQVAAGTYVDGAILDGLWPAGALAIAFAGWVPAGEPRTGISGDVLVPVLTTSAAGIATTLLIWDHFDRMATVTAVLASVTLVAALVQLTLLFRDRNRAHAEALEVESIRSASLEAALDCVVTIDSRGIVSEWNHAARRTFGFRKEEAIGHHMADLIIPPEDRDGFRHGMARMRSTGEAPILDKRIEVTASHARGGTFPIEMAVTRVRDDPPVFTAFIRDISDRRRREEENERLAAIVRSSEDAIVSKNLSGVVTAWNAGAEALYGYTADEAIGKPLEDLIVPPDRAGEAQAVSDSVASGGSSAIVSQRLTKNGDRREVSIRAFPIRNLAGVIIGVSVSAHDITDRHRREAKEHEDTDRRLWRRRIEEALAHDHLVFWGQPVIDVASGDLHHRELLIRMEFEGRIITPNEFLPHAESSELITEIDHWAVARGVELGFQSPVAINLSARSLSNPRLIDLIRRNLDSAGTPPVNVLFEITETAVAENLEAARVLVEQLRSLGCGVALDDFGTGYGSFTYLKHLPVTELKIDMSFIRGLTENDLDQRVVQSILMVANTFEMETVAEGVEDAKTLELLRSMGVDLVQGYYLGRPAPMEREKVAPAMTGRVVTS